MPERRRSFLVPCIAAVASVGVALWLTDVVMPQMNGRELSARLERSRPEMQTLFVSGYVDNVIVQQAKLDAGGAFLQKPFTGNSLTRKVREALDSKKQTKPSGPSR